MLKFRLKSNNDSKLIYEYFPEGKEYSGIVEVIKETGECHIVKLSENDNHNIYALKMFKRLREYAKNRAFDDEGTIAWY